MSALTTSEATDAIAAALAGLTFDHAKKDRTNDHFKASYATLASCLDAVRGPLTTAGIAILHGHETLDGGRLGTTCRLLHASGQWVETSIVLPVLQQSPQGFGSAATYGRRYTLLAICGLSSADDDDDGATASAPPPPQRAPSKAAKAKETPAETAARQADHHPSWEADRPGFFARIGEIPNATAASVGAVLERLKRPRASQMTSEDRAKLLDWLAGPAGQKALGAALPEPGSEG